MEKFYTFNEYMKKDKLTACEEDYVEMIYRLCMDNRYTRINDISKSLNVKPPSVTNMIKKLVEKKLVEHKEYGIIELSNTGLILGKYLYDRHNTIEEFLLLLKVKGPLLEEVEKIEHTISLETINAIKKLNLFFQKNDDIKEMLYAFFNSNQNN